VYKPNRITIKVRYIWCWGVGYLSQRSLGGGHLVEHPEGDAHDGGESQQPAHEVAPPRVHVHVVVLQRRVLDDGERKGALQGERDTKTKYMLLYGSMLLPPQKQKNGSVSSSNVISRYFDVLSK